MRMLLQQNHQLAKTKIRLIELIKWLIVAMIREINYKKTRQNFRKKCSLNKFSNSPETHAYNIYMTFIKKKRLN